MNQSIQLGLIVCCLFVLSACGVSRVAQTLSGATAIPIAKVLASPTVQPQRQQSPILVPTARPAPTEPPAPTTPSTALPAPPEAPTPDAVARQPNRIIIDSIGLDRSLVEVGLDANNIPIVPDYDAAWYDLSAHPGAGENIVVWGHALRFKHTPNIAAPFERVKDAHIGDKVTIITTDGTAFTYVISDQIWALPDQVAYLMPQGHEQLTIINCIGDIITGADNQLTTMYRMITVAQPVQ